MKISILGYSGSGKSTLAEYLGNYYQIPVMFLDKVQFTANLKERDTAEGLQLVADFMRKESWVIDGNYSKFMLKKRLEESDYIVILGFSGISCLTRVIKRYLKYKNTVRNSMADGCTEKLDTEFIWWVLYKGRNSSVRAHYQNNLNQYYRKVFIIKNQRQLNQFMCKLPLKPF